MSNRRAIVVLLVLLIAAVGANIWLDCSNAERIEVVRRRSLLRQSDNAVAYEITVPGRAKLRMEKSDDWRIVSPFRAVADLSGIERLSDALAFAPVVDSLEDEDAVRLGKTLEDFGLEVPRLSLQVESATGSFRVKFGAKAYSGDGVYAMVEGVPVVYVVPSEIYDSASQPVDSWRRRAVFHATSDEVVSIDIRRGGAAAVRLRRTDAGWEVVEPRKALASVAAVTRIIDTVLSCEVRKFVWPVGATNETVSASVALLTGYGLDPETCETVVFRTNDGRDHSISFGSVADADSVYALVHGGNAIATVAAAARDSVSLDAGGLIEGRLFPVEKSAVRRISLQDGDVSYLLARGEGGGWRLDSPVSAAADDAAVRSLLDKLLVMRNVDLDENGLKVSLSTNMAPVSVSKAALLGTEGFERLRSKTVLDIDPATVKRIVVSGAGDAMSASVVYDPDRKGWNVETTGRRGVIDAARLSAFLGVLSPLKAKSVIRLKVLPGELAKFGLENPSCTIAVDRLLEGSVRRNILLGATADRSGDTYATVGSSDAVFVLDARTVKILVSGVLER